MQNMLPASLQRYSPLAISNTFSTVRSVEQALAVSDSTPHLLALARERGCGREAVESLLKLHIFALDKFLKQKSGLTHEEIDLAAEEIISRYGGMLTFADIHVVFRNAKLGKYGELYNQLTCAKVIKWFDEYAGERMDKAEAMNRNADMQTYGPPSQHCDPTARRIAEQLTSQKNNDYARWRAEYDKNKTL